MTRDEVAANAPDALFADGFDEALIGTMTRCGMPNIALYDYDKCITVLAKQGMTHDDAVDYMEFNVVGAYMGDYTPAFAVLK